MGLRVKKWKEKDLQEQEVKWMFKGWSLSRTGWGSLEGQMGEASVRRQGRGAPGDLLLHSVYFSSHLEGNQNNSSFGWKRGSTYHVRFHLSLSLLLLLTAPGQLSVSPLPGGTYIIYDGELGQHQASVRERSLAAAFGSLAIPMWGPSESGQLK